MPSSGRCSTFSMSSSSTAPTIWLLTIAPPSFTVTPGTYDTMTSPPPAPVANVPTPCRPSFDTRDELSSVNSAPVSKMNDIGWSLTSTLTKIRPP